MNRVFVYLFCVLAALSAQCRSDVAASAPEWLRVEYVENPLGIDVAQPRFSWVVPGPQRGTLQAAYQLKVATSVEALESGASVTWDSGKVRSEKSINVEYAGPALNSHTRYYWSVRTWDNHGNVSEVADPEWFETAFTDESEWEGIWIGDGRAPPERPEDFYDDIPNPVFRKSFVITNPVEKARLYISGLGYYEAELNGAKVGDHVLEPGWTNYGKRVLYSTYDVTDQLQEGRNALGVALGNGWYNPLPLTHFREYNLREVLTIGQPKLIAELHIWSRDGSKKVVKSDETWTASTGPLLKNDIYLGEKYDARLEQQGWSTAEFDDEGWKSAIEVTPPGGRMLAQMAPPIRITKTIPAVSVTQPEPGVHVFDFGQNFAGWVRLTLTGKAGTSVKLRYGELLYENGRVNGLTTVAGHIKEMWELSGGPGAPLTAYQEDEYILKGGGLETFQQKFGFHGFRYVEVTGFSGELTQESMVGLRLNSDLRDAGSFTSSNKLFNRIQEVVEWTMLSNVFSIQSDCPGREKFGYGGDIVTAAEAFIHNFGMANFYRKTARDFQDDVRPNGGLPETAPYNGIAVGGFGEGAGPIGWQLAHPFTVLQLYRYYGDRRIVEEQYPTAQRMLEFLRTQAGADYYIEHGIGDHVSLSEKELPLTSTAFYFQIASLVSRFAVILGKAEDAEEYRELASDIAGAFESRFVDGESGILGSEVTQANQLFGLSYGFQLSEDELVEKAIDVLVDDIGDKHKGHLTTGIFSTKGFWDVADEYELNELAYRVVNQRDFPSYGYMIDKGATTLWETWKEPTGESHNHPMFGSVSEWFYESILGIQPGLNTVGMDTILIKPSPVGDLTFARGHYDSVRGRIAVDWTEESGVFDLTVTIPANVTATIALPVSEYAEPIMYEGGRVIFAGEQLVSHTGEYELAGRSAHRVEIEVGSGTYRFEVMDARNAKR